jgi:hypothetical protein
VQSVRNASGLSGKDWKLLREDLSNSKASEESEEFDFEKEFDLVLGSALNNNHSEAMHYFSRTRRMRLTDPNNFYTLAAETVVACFSNGRKKIDKYAAISLHLKKARDLINKNIDSQVEALDRIQRLADLIIDEFDYQI